MPCNLRCRALSSKPLVSVRVLTRTAQGRLSRAAHAAPAPLAAKLRLTPRRVRAARPSSDREARAATAGGRGVGVLRHERVRPHHPGQRDRVFAGVLPGGRQRARVKLTAYDYSIYGGLEGALEQIGADSVTDEKGNVYYTVRVRTRESPLGKDMPIIPGMVAEVDIVTGKKSFLAYMLKPILRAKQLAFSER